MDESRRPALAAQFGADYGDRKDFKRRFIRAMRQVLILYPAARVEQEAVYQLGKIGNNLLCAAAHKRFYVHPLVMWSSEPRPKAGGAFRSGSCT